MSISDSLAAAHAEFEGAPSAHELERKLREALGCGFGEWKLTKGDGITTVFSATTRSTWLYLVVEYEADENQWYVDLGVHGGSSICHWFDTDLDEIVNNTGNKWDGGLKGLLRALPAEVGLLAEGISQGDYEE